MKDAHWFKQAIIYELHVKSFADSNGDGVGDLRGLIEKLDYFTHLGVTALWLLPFYPSPLRDDGYDIADYFNVHPSYGTLEDFRVFLSESHRRGLRVITELVLNHTSDQHPWFQRARRAEPGSPHRNFYVWSKDGAKYREARVIFRDFEESNWSWDAGAKAFYWHRFYAHQPDLNFESEPVRRSLFEVIDFWLGLGVDGLRLDAVPYLFERDHTSCENLPETHAFLRELRRHVDERFEGRMLLGEANQWPEDAVHYFGAGDECHMNFHFPLMPRLFMALQMEDRFPIVDILQQTPDIPEGCQWATFLRNHDELTLEMVTDEERDYMYRVYAADHRARINLGIRRRLSPLLGNSRRRVELIHSLLLSLPGTPILYYGDEIGMGDNIYLGDRDGVRTPMQWSPDRNAGFSKANPQRLYLPVIVDPEYHYESVNVENQQRNPSSLYWWMRRLISMRQSSRALGQGTLEFLHPDNGRVLAYLRRAEEEVVLVVANLSRHPQMVELDLERYSGWVPQEIFGQAPFPPVRAAQWIVTLGAHDFYWLRLQARSEGARVQARRSIPVLGDCARWSPTFLEEFIARILPGYVESCRWFGGRGLRALSLAGMIPVDVEEDAARVLFLEAQLTEGLPETYVLPVQVVQGEAAERLLREGPASVIARTAEGGVVCDGLWEESFREALMAKFLQAARGEDASEAVPGWSVVLGRDFDPAAAQANLAHSQVLKSEQSNSSVAYGTRYFLKLYRKWERGVHPEVRLVRHLSEATDFDALARFGGALSLQGSEGMGVVGLLVDYTVHQGDGWQHALDSLARFFERVSTAEAASTGALTELIGGVYPDRVRQIGERTGELHWALGGNSDEPGFAPEAFTGHSQRALYQSMRSALGRALRSLRRALPDFSEPVRAVAKRVLASGPELLAHQARLLGTPLKACKILIHGDYHLGQVLNTGKDFVVIDFEGEPRRSIGERSLKRPALQDVAGMVRSFDYAAQVALARERPEDQPKLGFWADAWSRSMAEVFVGAYREKTRGAVFVPDSLREFDLLLETLVLDKALYELEYELAYRPDFVGIPLRAIERLVTQELADAG